MASAQAASAKTVETVQMGPKAAVVPHLLRREPAVAALFPMASPVTQAASVAVVMPANMPAAVVVAAAMAAAAPAQATTASAPAAAVVRAACSQRRRPVRR